MTSVGGVDLEISDNNVVAGAVFLMSLEGFGTADWSAEPPYVVEVDGQRVRLINGHAAFVSLRTGCSEPHAVMAQALEVAQRALDLEAARGKRHGASNASMSSTSSGGGLGIRRCCVWSSRVR